MLPNEPRATPILIPEGPILTRRAVSVTPGGQLEKGGFAFC